MRFTNVIKNKSKSMYITIIITTVLTSFVIGLFGYKSDNNSSFESAVLVANGLAESISDSFVLIKPSMNTLLNYDNINGFWSFIVYILESFIVYIIMIYIMSMIYIEGAKGTTINSSKSNHRKRKLSLKDFRKKNIRKAYLDKELKTLVRTPIFFLQCIVMPIIYPIAIYN